MLLEGILKSERADKELQAIVTLGVSEEVLVTIAFCAKGSRQQTFICTRQ